MDASFSRRCVAEAGVARFAEILAEARETADYVVIDTPGGDTALLEKGGEIKMTQSAVVLENLIGQLLYGKAAEGEKK